MAAVQFFVVPGTVIGTNVKTQKDVRQSKTLIVETADTVDAADTIPLTLAKYGITTVLGVDGYKHTTNNSVVVTEAPTTAVSAGVLTITVPAGTDNDKRIYVITYE